MIESFNASTPATKGPNMNDAEVFKKVRRYIAACETEYICFAVEMAMASKYGDVQNNFERVQQQRRRCLDMVLAHIAPHSVATNWWHNNNPGEYLTEATAVEMRLEVVEDIIRKLQG